MFKCFDLSPAETAWLREQVVAHVNRLVTHIEPSAWERKPDGTHATMIPLVPFFDPEKLFNNSGGKSKIGSVQQKEYPALWHVVYRIKGDILNVLLAKEHAAIYDAIGEFSQTLSRRLGRAVGGKKGSFISILSPGYTLPPHRDPTEERVHIPVVTNAAAQFSTFRGEAADALETVERLHMEAGSVYSLTTAGWHSVTNGSVSQPRIHLVMDCRPDIDIVL
jgi:hypothetical protein